MGAVGLLALGGCYTGVDTGLDSADGSATDPDVGTSGDVPEDEESGGSGDTGEPDDTGPEVGACDPSDLGASTLRRLNRREYRNTVQDLFGFAQPPELLLPWDNLSARGLDNDGDALALDVAAAEQYFDAAEIVYAALDVEGTSPFVACADLVDDELAGCLDAEVEAWLELAFRRPVPPAAATLLRGLLADEDTYDDAVETATIFTLTSPYFLFHYQASAADGLVANPGAMVVADRLAYLVWSSTPDRQLLDAAFAGDLSSPVLLEAEVDRMLADPKASRLYTDFPALWLKLGILDEKPDALEHAELFSDMQEETTRFFGLIATGDLPIRNLLDSDQSVINGRLADHYGVDSVLGDDEWALTELPAGERGGVLTHGSVLVASAGTEFSDPIRRGTWIAEQIVCLEPPPPPFDPPELPSLEESGAETVRELLEEHRADPVCAACHQFIDPYGLALENYDRFGLFREAYDNGAEIDASGVLADGSAFENAVEMTKAISEGNDFEACAAEFLSSYGVGRALSPDEACFVDLVIEQARGAEGGITFRDLVVSLASSYLFVTGEE